ncbi:ATP-dependent DNA helicase RecG [Propionibacteriaceae bacterium Y1923]
MKDGPPGGDDDAVVPGRYPAGVDNQWQTRTFERLNTPVDRFVGDKTAKAFAQLRVHTVGDLLRHVPRRYLAGTENSDLTDLPIGEDVAVMAIVDSVQVAGQSPRRRVEAVLTDGRGRLSVTFFGKDYLVKFWVGLLSGRPRGIFVGRVGEFNNRPQLTHPKFVLFDERGNPTGKSDQSDLVASVSRSGLVGIYPAVKAVQTWTISATIAMVLEQVADDLVEPLPEWVLESEQLPTMLEAFQDVHLPDTRERAERGIERLLFDEALALQLAMAQRRSQAAQDPAAVMQHRPGGLLDALDQRLPFTLTPGQQQVCDEIFTELAREHPMQRLLQGEVGSGKTVVATRAMTRAIDAGYQAALLAPTEVLATQHADTLRGLLGDLGDGQVLGAPEQATKVVLLTGSMPAAARKQALLDIASGEAGIVIGTHALLGDQVQFANLGLVIVDEQHRFGVEQRAVLGAKAELRPHVLVMTATPIPRSVAMTVFGDLETSTLREIPAGRSEVQTTVVDTTRHPAWVSRAWERITEEVAAGRQAFVVCSRISKTQTDTDPFDQLESDEAMPDPVGVEELAEQLATGPLRGTRVAVLHGRMSAEEKADTMTAFAAGEVDVLVSTTVIEVGVDVPNASMMVVMDADRFGISQLHQLRGRIGRGSHAGVCLLVSHAPPGSPAARRLAAVARSRDGFALAEDDLAARREGNILGSSQAGTRSSLRLLRVLEHLPIIEASRTIAARLVTQDPHLENPYLADMVRQTELLAAGDWLEKG